MIKHWARERNFELSSLAAEVLVLQYMPEPRMGESLRVGEAMAEFFEQAADRVAWDGLSYRGRQIQPGLDYGALRRALRTSAEQSRTALQAEQEWANGAPSDPGIEHPALKWRKVFGERYPVPWLKIMFAELIRWLRPRVESETVSSGAAGVADPSVGPPAAWRDPPVAEPPEGWDWRPPDPPFDRDNPDPDSSPPGPPGPIIFGAS